jgi:hypothetical protein
MTENNKQYEKKLGSLRVVELGKDWLTKHSQQCRKIDEKLPISAPKEIRLRVHT